MEIRNPNTNTVLKTLYSTNPGDPNLNSCVNRTSDISEFIGQAIRVAFIEEDNFFFFNVHIDDICIDTVSATAYGGGSGTLNDPFLISDPNHLQTLSVNDCNWNEHFKLTADLDLTGVAMTPIGNLATKFTGTFNGNGYALANLTINLPATDYVGLFGYVENAVDPKTIYNLGLINPNITGDDFVGGLAGRLDNGTLTGCYADGGSVNGGGTLGGLVGWNDSSSISNSYATDTVTGDKKHVGGLVGENSGGTIIDCYAIGAVSGPGPKIGGLVGIKIGGGTTSNSFWDIDTSGQASSAGGTGKTTAQMQTASTFTDSGWDFVGESANGTEDIWRMCVDGVDYPRLTWQYLSIGDFGCPDGVAMEDWVVFASWWGATNCEEANDWCGGADFDQSGTVDLVDALVFFGNWLSEI